MRQLSSEVPADMNSHKCLLILSMEKGMYAYMCVLCVCVCVCMCVRACMHACVEIMYTDITINISVLPINISCIVEDCY